MIHILISKTNHVKWTINIKSIPYRSAPTADATGSSANYQWPPSPILPSISSRTPHLIPVTIMPTTESDEQQNNDLPFTSTNHHNNSRSDYNSNEYDNSNRGSIVTQNNNHRSAS